MIRKIGETFELFGYKLRVDKQEPNDCEGCFFYEHNIDCLHKEIYSVTGKCINVIFKEIKEDMKVLLFSCVFLLLSSCAYEEYKLRDSDDNLYKIDTLDIHGVQHEFIVSYMNSLYNGFVHSPECWCLTKKDRQND